MNIGSLRHRIEFQRLETTYDKEGFPIEEYVTFQKAWADINDLCRKECKQDSFWIRYYNTST